MRCFCLLVHGVLDWSPNAVERWKIPDTRPRGFHCRKYLFARSKDDAAEKALAKVQSYYEETTDWFINDLLNMHLTIEEIKIVPFYKGLFKHSFDAEFYPLKQ